MKEVLIVAVGGSIGAVSRFLVNGWVHRWRPPVGFPYATLCVNVVGCLGIGILMTLLTERAALSRESQLLLVTGLLGSLTTFSTFGYETWELAIQDRMPLAVANVVANLVVGILAVAAGRWIVRLF